MNQRSEIVKQGYAVIAETYHQGRLEREQVNVEWLDGMRDNFPSSGNIVDLGCGTGVPLTRYFANRGYQVTGYDISEQMLEIARREVPQAQFFQAAMEELELEPGSLDMVVSFFAVIHLDRDLHLALFEKIARWLRPGGVVLMSLGAEDNPDDRQESWHGAPMVWSHFGAERNLELLRAAGLEPVWHEIEDFGFEKHLFVLAKKG